MEEDTFIPELNDDNYNGIILGDEDENNFYNDYDITKYKSSNILSKYEKTQILINRTLHLINGSQPYINTINFTNNYDIAVEELNQKKLPYIIKRTNGDKIEHWKLEDLII
mgnify:CR=1 FL=1